MADNLTRSDSFSFANMKPDSGGGEVISAEWGRKLAANTAWLLYHRRQVGYQRVELVRDTDSYDFQLRKHGTTYLTPFVSTEGTVHGSWCFHGTGFGGGGDPTIQATVIIDGTQVVATTFDVNPEVYSTGSFAMLCDGFASNVEKTAIVKLYNSNDQAPITSSIDVTYIFVP